jgi:hypothetical protein
MTSDQPFRDYKRCATDMAIDLCPVCAHSSALFEYTSGASDDGRSFVVSCDSPSPESFDDFECPMNPPPTRFHCERKKSAVEFWNEYARSVEAVRAKNTQEIKS